MSIIKKFTRRLNDDKDVEFTIKSKLINGENYYYSHVINKSLKENELDEGVEITKNQRLILKRDKESLESFLNDDYPNKDNFESDL